MSDMNSVDKNTDRTAQTAGAEGSDVGYDAAMEDAGPFCGCRDYSCPVNDDPQAMCCNAEY